MSSFQYVFCVAIALTSAISWIGCKDTPGVYPQRKDIIETVYASGKIMPENEYRLSALGNGTILEKLVKDGDTVKKGQTLYVISNEAAREKYDAALKNYEIVSINLSERSPLLNDLKLSLQSAEVKFRNDSITWQRWKNLWDREIGTKSNLDNAHSSYLVSLNQKKIAEQKYYSALNDIRIAHSNARSQLSAARKDLSEYYIKSDRNGVVYQTFKEAGEAVHSNEVVAMLGEHRKRIVRLAVDQSDIDKIQIGQQVLMEADVTGGKIYEAAVTYIFPVMNEADQTFRVDAHFGELPDQLFIHSTIEANIIIQKKKNALVLPRSALADKDSVWIMEKGRRKKVGIKTGVATLDYVEILSGVDDKTEVVINTK